MGFLGTIATFGIGYAAGAVSGRQGLERLSTRVSEALPQQVRSACRNSSVQVTAGGPRSMCERFGR